MNDEQREAQYMYGQITGIHNTLPGQCMECGKLVKVGMKSECPHEETSQNNVVYPLGAD